MQRLHLKLLAMKNKFQPGRIELLIDVSEKLFSEKGYGETSVRDIAKEASVNIAMINYYFGSKKQLVKAIIKDRARKLWQRFESRQYPNKDITCESIVDDMADAVYSHPHFFMLLLQIQSIAGMRSDLEYFIIIQRKYVDYISNELQLPASCGYKFKTKLKIVTLNAFTMLLSHVIVCNTLTEKDRPETLSKEEAASDILV